MFELAQLLAATMKPKSASGSFTYSRLIHLVWLSRSSPSQRSMRKAIFGEIPA
jgi:hypothetical protein